MLASVPDRLSKQDTPLIVFVIGTTEVGGAELHLMNVSARLVRQGFQCYLIALDPVGKLESAFERAGVRVLGVRIPKSADIFFFRIPRIRSLVRNTLALPYLCWQYWRLRPDVVHFFLPAAYIIGALASLCGPRVSRVMSRRSRNFYQTKRPLYRCVEHWLHSKMDVVCGNSLRVIEDLRAEGVHREQLRLIYNGIDSRSFCCDSALKNNARYQLSIEENVVVFVMVANLISYKGHADLIEAFGMIRDRLPNGWICLCIGRDDGIKSALQEQADRLGIGNNVRFLGSRQDVPDLLAAADIGVLCSHEEGFSNAVLECMAAALPMVVTDVGGNAEAVEHGVTGLVVAPHAPVQLADALLSLTADSNRAAMGAAGRHRVETLFSMEACVKAYIDLYSSATDKVGLPAT